MTVFRILCFSQSSYKYLRKNRNIFVRDICLYINEDIPFKAAEIWLSVLSERACPKNIHALDWFFQYFSASFQFISNFSKFKLQTSKIVSLFKIRMFPTGVFCQCVKLNRDSVCSCFFKQLNIADETWYDERNKSLCLRFL